MKNEHDTEKWTQVSLSTIPYVCRQTLVFVEVS